MRRRNAIEMVLVECPIHGNRPAAPLYKGKSCPVCTDILKEADVYSRTLGETHRGVMLMWPWENAPLAFKGVNELSHSTRGGERLAVFVPEALLGADLGALSALVEAAWNPEEGPAQRRRREERSYVEGLGWAWSLKLDGGVLILIART